MHILFCLFYFCHVIVIISFPFLTDRILIFFYKIILIVRAFLIGLQVVLIAIWSTNTKSAIWLTVSELWEFTVRASYIVFLFVKTENNNFIKEIKHVLPPKSVENLSKVCENSRAGKSLRLRLGFSLICSRILLNVRLSFHQALKARKTCFVS